MLDMGFIRAIRRIIKLLPAERQNLMFSATYSDDIRALASRLLRDPLTIEVAQRNAAAERVEQHVYRVPKEHKRHSCRTSSSAATGTRCWSSRAPSTAPTASPSNSSPMAFAHSPSTATRARRRACVRSSDFKQNRTTALVATEVAARGLDIKELPHVVNYRPAQRARGLRSPHRPHRACRRQRRRGVAGRPR